MGAFNVIDTNHASRFFAKINKMYIDQHTSCDVILKCEGKTIKCHRLILQTFSTYFANLFSDPASEKMPFLCGMFNCKYAHLDTLIRFMYLGRLSTTDEEWPEIVECAEQLGIAKFRELNSAKPAASGNVSTANGPSEVSTNMSDSAKDQSRKRRTDGANGSLVLGDKKAKTAVDAANNGDKNAKTSDDTSKSTKVNGNGKKAMKAPVPVSSSTPKAAVSKQQVDKSMQDSTRSTEQDVLPKKRPIRKPHTTKVLDSITLDDDEDAMECDPLSNSAKNAFDDEFSKDPKSKNDNGDDSDSTVIEDSNSPVKQKLKDKDSVTTRHEKQRDQVPEKEKEPEKSKESAKEVDATKEKPNEKEITLKNNEKDATNNNKDKSNVDDAEHSKKDNNASTLSEAIKDETPVNCKTCSKAMKPGVNHKKMDIQFNNKCILCPKKIMFKRQLIDHLLKVHKVEICQF